jgi:hypothetical protein
VSGPNDSGFPWGGLNLAHSTITDNESTSQRSSPAVYGDFVDTTIHHTIIADNTSAGGPADLELDSDVATIDYSLIRELGSNAEAVELAGTGNVIGFSAGLGPLANNGGLTLTHLPLATSRALESGNPSIVGAPATDQRGEARVVGIIEIGAVEVAAVIPPTGTNATPPLTIGGLLVGLGALLVAGAALRKRQLTA